MVASIVVPHRFVVFLDAPLIMSPVDLPGAQALSGSHSKRESRQVPSKHSPRAWWTPPLEGEEIDAREVHASLVYLKDAIASKGPFNVRTMFSVS
jgi:hypothetical protein